MNLSSLSSVVKIMKESLHCDVYFREKKSYNVTVQIALRLFSKINFIAILIPS